MTSLVLALVFLCSGCVTMMGPPIYSHGMMANMTTTPNGKPEKYSQPDPLAADAASLAAGQKLFEDNCEECHGVGGRGDGPSALDLDGPKPVDLVASAKRHTDGELFGLIYYGRPDMPTWRKVLTGEQVWNIVHYVRSLGGKMTLP